MSVTRQLISGLGAGLLLLLGACGGGDGDDGDNSPNLPPGITGLVDVTASANETSMPLSFNVTDDGDPARVTLSASSSDPALLPDDGIQFGGSGASRTLTVTPQPGALGTARVTVVATDSGGLRATEEFTVNVIEQNVSFSALFREAFNEPENNEPQDLNSRTFDQDAAEDEFDDLIGAP